MNERLKELMIEVGYVEWQDWVQLEKFAQLIIDECCDIIDEDGYSTLNQCVLKIEKHFGML